MSCREDQAFFQESGTGEVGFASKLCSTSLGDHAWRSRRQRRAVSEPLQPRRWKMQCCASSGSTSRVRGHRLSWGGHSAALAGVRAPNTFNQDNIFGKGEGRLPCSLGAKPLGVKGSIIEAWKRVEAMVQSAAGLRFDMDRSS
ncbi:hypothetical protein L7F22_004651 [Adiantum nelumboides]|nr:hypothetical protein [Adiantum nelumboides]